MLLLAALLAFAFTLPEVLFVSCSHFRGPFLVVGPLARAEMVEIIGRLLAATCIGASLAHGRSFRVVMGESPSKRSI